MKKIYSFLAYSTIAVCISAGLTSCTDYLDKEADSTVSEDVAFVNFNNFQGYIEEMYNCIPDKEKCYWVTTFNWGEDEIMNSGLGDSHMTHQVDLGAFRNWSTNGQNWLYRNPVNSDPKDKFNHSLWPHAWYCIRKANMGLENLDKLTVASQEEKNIIAGQLYFFRAWWYEELMQWFGGLPYLKHSIEATQKMEYPRLSFQECADSCAEDFRKAADLLPVNWDKTTVGRKTLGKNDLRINKITALGYLGKVLLWASSPLMEHGAELSGSKTYDYNKEYARRAAEAFGELLALVESGQTQYALAEFDYSDIYNHIKSSSAKTCFSDIFYTTGQNWKMPGSTEAIMRGPSTDFNGSNWNFTKTWGTKINSLVEHDNVIHQPTANYVNYAYGMANGLPITDPNSGFDPEHPFKNRDPRFYHDIIFDGFKYVNTTIPASDPSHNQQYTGFYTGGQTRDAANASRTGYYTQKLVPHTANKFDGTYNWSGSLHIYLPYMRLADIYLMYAEACAAFGGASAKASNFGKTAEDAINVLRDRVGSGHVAASYVADDHKFMDEVRRERAAELAFEGFRFNDLQRWLLLTVYPYNVKTSQEFDRQEDESFFKNNDPRDAKVSNWREENIVTRVFGTKHYWFPLLDRDIYLYEDFPQNPGW